MSPKLSNDTSIVAVFHHDLLCLLFCFVFVLRNANGQIDKDTSYLNLKSTCGGQAVVIWDGMSRIII